MSRRFRIALSFAGEKRAFVLEMARLLAKRFDQSAVLYDHWHEAELNGPAIMPYLGQLYHDQSDLIVAVISPNYLQSDWCGLEWDAVYGLMRSRHRDVMLMRFGQAVAHHMFGTEAYVELDEKSPAQAAQCILDRLAQNEGSEPARAALVEEKTDEPDWPHAPPPLDWRIADHTEARDAFKQLIVREPPFRVMLVHGPSGTGKTCLVGQFMSNAERLPGLRYGRLDFKGTTGLDVPLRAFARDLNVESPEREKSVVGKLAEIAHLLQSRAQPTLLVFDSFDEIDADGRRWFSQNLLEKLHRMPWLRVVLVGQDVPDPDRESWRRLSSRRIKLSRPSPEQWLEIFGHIPEVDLKLMRTVVKAYANKPIAEFMEFFSDLEAE